MKKGKLKPDRYKVASGYPVNHLRKPLAGGPLQAKCDGCQSSRTSGSRDEEAIPEYEAFAVKNIPSAQHK